MAKSSGGGGRAGRIGKSLSPNQRNMVTFIGAKGVSSIDVGFRQSFSGKLGRQYASDRKTFEALQSKGLVKRSAGLGGKATLTRQGLSVLKILGNYG